MVVFTCYRAVALTIDCLHSLAPQIGDVPGTKVVICENGSGHEAVRQLCDAIEANGWGDWVMVKAIEPNRGFSGGNNAVLDEVLTWPEPPRYLLLLNTDTIVRPAALRHLYDTMERQPSLGIVGPTLLGPDGEVHRTVFRAPSPCTEFLRAANTGLLNRLLRRDAFELTPRTEQGSEHDWASFACALIRREVFQQVGTLDEGFFLYFDDPDLCGRARRAGWGIAKCPEAEVVHLEGASNSVPEDARARKRKPRYFYAARARYFAKHRGMMGLWLANCAWNLGRVVSKSREVLTRKPTHVCKAEWRDIWIGAFSPLSRSAAPDNPAGNRAPAASADSASARASPSS